MGVPTGVTNLEFSALPIRCYNLIFNEFYRDQDLVTAVSEDSLTLQQIAWEKDYFTSSRPWAQRGPDVTLPLGTEAPIYGKNMDFDDIDDAGNTVNIFNSTGTGAALKTLAAGGTNVYGRSTSLGNGTLTVDLSDATAATVNDIREAFALQRFQEARARYGARYTEYLAYLGVNSGDARLQRPEYLGGGKQTVSFSEVLQTSNDGTNGNVGDMFGHGISAMRSKRYRKFFTEHGYVVSLLSVRPKSMYMDGLHRTWNRRTNEDYFQKELQHIGQQEILNKEVYANATVPADRDWETT